jgi:predicted O-methyltransferase YrrM
MAKKSEAYMLRFYSLFLLLCLFGCSNSELPEPYCQLDEVLPFDPQGWYGNRKPMEKLIDKHDVKVVIEVGSWLGASTRHIATCLPKDGKVYAVDHWLGSAEHQHRETLSKLYEQFLSNVIHKKLTNKIIPIRMASVEAEKFLSDVKPDLIYIDASHETEAVYQDLTVWFPHVKGHGILCGDDWAWPSVQKAVIRFAEENHLAVEGKGAFWLLAETKL